MAATRTIDQQKSVRVDDAFLAACHNTGVNLHELDAKTLDDFHDGPTPPVSPSASTSQPSPPPSSPRGRGPAIPKEILERRHKNYEALRLRKLHVVLVERDRLIRKGYFTDEGTATGSGNHPLASEPTPVPPAPSRAPGSSLVAAPPTAVPKPPPQSQQQSTLSSRRGSNSFRRASNGKSATTTSKSNKSDSARDNQIVVSDGVRGSKADIEPLNFEDGDKIAASSQSFSVSASFDPPQKRAGDPDIDADSKGNFHEASYSSFSQQALSSSTTPRLPPCEGATTPSATNRALLMGGGSNSTSYHKKSQKELIIENAYRQHKQRTLLSQRLAQAQLLKEAKEEDQQRRAAEAQLRDMEDAKQRDERARLIHQANLQQAENRNRRDELLRQMREENARVEMEMGALELEAKTRELEDVRKKQMQLLEQKREQARQRNEKSMQSAREKQLLLTERQQANLERKGLLFELAGGSNNNNSGRKSNHSPFQASSSGNQSDEGYESAHKIANSKLKRRQRRQAEEQRFEEKRQREAQRLATAAEIAEQTRLRALMTIQQKEMRSREHLTRETAARDHYMMSNVNTTTANIEKSKEARMRQEEEMRLYRELLELERNETQEERDRRVFLESQLKNEDRLARDEWRRSVAERSKRYEALKQLDADMRSRAKQEAAEQRRREIQETIEAIKAGALEIGGEDKPLGGGEAILSM